ncbi:MAG: hypothetical protein ACO3QA_09855 [Phycisphaerales bacterium]
MIVAAVFGVASVGALDLGCAAARTQAMPDRSDATARIAEADRRLAQLERFEATGTVVLPVRSGSGAIDEEQLDLLLLRERPGRLAIRLKLSVTDTLAWLGSDGTRWWLFLPEETPSTVWHGMVASSGNSQLEDESIPLPPGLRHPRIVDVLLGLEPADDLASLEWNSADRRWWIESPVFGDASDDSGWTVRRGYAETGPVAEVIEVRDAAGMLGARSRLAGHERVEVPDRPVGDWPLVPMRIEVSGSGAEDPPARLSLERPSGRGGRVKAAAFDWGRLLESMRPERIVQVGASS